MKIKKIYVGSWYPRTLFHLNELHKFLSDGTSNLSLDKEKLHKLKKELNPQNVELKQDLGQSLLTAKFEEYNFESHENGLTLLSLKDVSLNNVDKSMAKLSEFAFKNVFASFGYLYSQGAPIPKLFSAMKSVMPYTIITEGMSKEDVIYFLKKKGQSILKEFKNKKIAIYYGETVVIINGDINLAESIVQECIYYLHDAESQFHRILNMHRFIWEEVSAIKSKKVIKYKDLSTTRDLVMEIESEVVFFKSRIEQLDNILKAQAARVASLSKSNDPVCFGFLDGFKALIASGAYVRSLWSMTEDYLAGASKLISTVYQESSNKQMNALQFIFIISAVASILALGSVAGFDIIGFLNNGSIRATAISFSWKDFFRLGGMAIGSGISIYILWSIAYSNLAGSKISDPSVMANSELEKIKKMIA